MTTIPGALRSGASARYAIATLPRPISRVTLWPIAALPAQDNAATQLPIKQLWRKVSHFEEATPSDDTVEWNRCCCRRDAIPRGSPCLFRRHHGIDTEQRYATQYEDR